MKRRDISTAGADNVVWVPANETRLGLRIAAGSGIVSVATASAMWLSATDQVEIGFEGNLYGASNLDAYADRVYHAWGRQVESYPTTARAWVSTDDLISIGNFDTVEGRVVLDDDEAVAMLEAWIGRALDGPDDPELLCTDFSYQRRRAVRRMLVSPDFAIRERAEVWAREHSISL